MKIHQVRWCTLNKLEIRFQYVTKTQQYVGIPIKANVWTATNVSMQALVIALTKYVIKRKGKEKKTKRSLD